ncbi:hypothetical protein V1498_16425 [Peribacillus sp. SCS-26]|uniref:hypothetical protein n=1 Tax=Paraperibacillus marinus TaxID=3115295 RepID=UPI003906865C
MQKFIVVGNFRFLGFYLCKRLLEEGYEVVGIDWGSGDEAAFESKFLEVGRNGNFSYLPMDEWQREGSEDPEAGLLVSYYDFIKSGMTAGEEWNMLNAFSQESGWAKQAVFFLPRGYSPGIPADIFGHSNCRKVSLPTIYGPWQPAHMCFQAAIEGRSKEEISEICKSECNDDAIFAEDLMQIIPSILKGREQEISVWSDAPRSWQQCAEQVGIEYPPGDFLDGVPREHSGSQLLVPVLTTPENGILKQTEHFMKFQQLSRW